MRRARYTDRKGIVRWGLIPDNPPEPPPPPTPEPEPRSLQCRVPSEPVMRILDAWWDSRHPWKDLAEQSGISLSHIYELRSDRPKTVRYDVHNALTQISIPTKPPTQPFFKRARLAALIREGHTLDEAAEIVGTTRGSALDAARIRIKRDPTCPDTLTIRAAARKDH